MHEGLFVTEAQNEFRIGVFCHRHRHRLRSSTDCYGAAFLPYRGGVGQCEDFHNVVAVRRYEKLSPFTFDHKAAASYIMALISSHTCRRGIHRTCDGNIQITVLGFILVLIADDDSDIVHIRVIPQREKF